MSTRAELSHKVSRFSAVATTAKGETVLARLSSREVAPEVIVR
jgi:hypothetical protein